MIRWVLLGTKNRSHREVRWPTLLEIDRARLPTQMTDRASECVWTTTVPMFLCRQLFHKQSKSPTRVIIRVSSTHPPHSILILCTPRKQGKCHTHTHTHVTGVSYPWEDEERMFCAIVGVCACMPVNLCEELRV